MLDFNEIKLEDKELFDGYLKKSNPQASELTFTNLFMWRKYYKIRFAEYKGMLCIVSTPDGAAPFAFVPIGKADGDCFADVVSGLKEYFADKGWELTFKRVAADELAHFDFIKEKEVIPDRDSSDYVYSVQDLTHLKGKKFDGKRNHINRFKKEYEFEYIHLTSEHFDECKRIMDEWCAERTCDEHKVLYCEKLANMEVLQNYDKLNLKGAIIKVNGRFEAFTAGEMLNSDTAVIHIEKANSHIRGLYTLINQQFCENEWQEAIFVNREQDLGVEGLRKAKLSYNPVKMIEKYTIVIK